MTRKKIIAKSENIIETLIFSSRWLQAPLYLGLIVAQCVYTYKFLVELFHILTKAGTTLDETKYLLAVLNLIDIIMVANLIAMVTIGGYATFVSKLHMAEEHKDRPDWLNHIDPGTIKVKLASSLIGISSIHLLQTFIDVKSESPENIKWQVIIHVTFIFSTFFMAISEYYMSKKHMPPEEA
jgi:uncharacterized protein (TIGR00645 family)